MHQKGHGLQELRLYCIWYKDPTVLHGPMISPPRDGRRVAEKRLAPYFCASILVYLFSLHAKQEKNTSTTANTTFRASVCSMHQIASVCVKFDLMMRSHLVTHTIIHYLSETRFYRIRYYANSRKERKKFYTRVKFTS